MFNGAYGSRLGIASVLSIIYIGVVVSDMITFGLGAALRAGVLNAKSVKILSGDGFKRAVAQIQRWGRWIGTVQRFSLGFRGPLCLVCGFTGVSPQLFASGVAVGTVGTMALQIAAGLAGSINAHKLPTEEKQARDTPKGLRGSHNHPESQEPHIQKETHVATGENRPGNFPRDPEEKAKLVGKDNPEIHPNVQSAPEGQVKSASGANTTYDKVTVAGLGDTEKDITSQVDKA
eukprot:jgi/Astpho2/230/Aster-02133